jgi:nucleotide-binding universal stress UspA family protein
MSGTQGTAPAPHAAGTDQVAGLCVTVGVDGSETNESALKWAAGEAELSGAPLRLVYVISKSLQDSPYFTGGMLDGFVNRLLARSRAIVEDHHQGLDIQTEVVTGSPRSKLIDAGRDASLLVVGRRGHSTFGELLLGSVAVSVAARSVVPTVVIPHMWQRELHEDDPIVVGIDGEGGSEDAIGFAFEMARSHSAPLTAVHVAPAGEEYIWNEYARGKSAEEWRSETLGFVEAAIDAKRRDFPHVDVAVSPQWGHPVRVLVDESAAAQALVLGGERHGRIRAGMLGSVAHGALHHALCPVVTVHADTAGP